MKKFLLYLLVWVAVLPSMLFSLSSCSNNKKEKEETEENVSYDKIVFTIAKKGDSNSLNDINNEPIAGPTTENNIELSGLGINKSVLVRINIYVSNYSDSEYEFKPYIEINNATGYNLVLENNVPAKITTINEGTADQAIHISELSKVIAAGQTDTKITYLFAYSCRKELDLLSLSQEWKFYAADMDNKLIKNVIWDLTFPKNPYYLDEPQIVYNDDSIDIITNDPNIKFADYVEPYDNTPILRDIVKKNNKYTIPITKSGKYILKLRSNDLKYEDYDKEFEVKVLSAPEISVDSNKMLNIEKSKIANESIIEIINKNTNELCDSSKTNKSEVNLSEMLTSYNTGRYKVLVYSNSTLDEVFKSPTGSAIDVDVLSAPQIDVNGKTISWEKVTNAKSYKIYKNGEFIHETNELTYFNRDFLINDKIYVIASNSMDAYTFDSPRSNEVLIKTA